MEKEFNIFGEFETEPTGTTTPVIEDTADATASEDEELETILKEKAAEASKTKGKPEEDEDEEEEDNIPPHEKAPSVTDEDEDEEEVGEFNFKALANVLAEEGAIDYEESDEDENSIDLISKAVVKTAENMLSEYKQSLPEKGRQFLEYLEKGGDPNKYLEKAASNKLTDLDLDDEDNQKRVVSEYLKLSDYTEEEIEELLQDYEDGLILDKQAKMASKRLAKIYEKEEAALIKEQEAKVEEDKKRVQDYVNTIHTTIDSSDSLAGLEVSKADKKALKAYLLETGKDGMTQWQRDLKEGAAQTQLELAYLKMKKFNFDKVAKQAQTATAKRFKSIFDGKDTITKGRSKQYRETGKGDLSGFNALLA